jgi:hypothetical protein
MDGREMNPAKNANRDSIYLPSLEICTCILLLDVDTPRDMSKIRQIDYSTPRTLISYNGRRTVRMTGEETRYRFSGVLIAGEEDAFAKIGEERKDWQKSAFPFALDGFA